MQLAHLGLRKFRNIQELGLDLHPKVNVFVGANGQGKTNILEALYFLIQGDSFRPGTSDAFLMKNPPDGRKEALVYGQVSGQGLSSKLEVRWQNGKKNHRLNDKGASRRKLLENYSVVLFSPESLSAIKSGPDERRRLVDEMIGSFGASNMALVADYKKCLKSRNKVLKDAKKGFMELAEAKAVIESLNGRFLPLATQLTAARTMAIKGIQPLFSKAAQEVLRLENVDIAVDYLITSESALEWAPEAVSRALESRMKELQNAEFESAQSLVGPHKHDINFVFGGEDSRYYCSQGQQRALILAFKMAQIKAYREERSADPLLLLDDVFSELDEEKRLRLMDSLKSVGSQIFITTTDYDFPQTFGGDMFVFKVANGKVTKVS